MLRGKTYEELRSNFRWEIPEYYNIGVDVCDKWANEKYRLALIYIDQEGKEQKLTLTNSSKVKNAHESSFR